MSLDTVMIRQRKDQSLIYYEKGINIFNFRLSQM